MFSIEKQYFATSSNATSGSSINRFNLSGFTVSHTSMQKNTGYDFVAIKAINQNSPNAFSTATVVSIQNEMNMTSTSGGAVYEPVIAGTTIVGYIPCDGGSATATAGNGTQKVTITSEKTTKTWTSGEREVIGGTTSTETKTITPNHPSLTGSTNEINTNVQISYFSSRLVT